MKLEDLLKLMVENNASDLFITAGSAPSIKVDGVIMPASRGVLSAEQSQAIVYSVMNPAQREEFENTRESNFAINSPDIGRFRVNVFRQQDHVGMVVRKIETTIPTFEELKLPPLLKELAMEDRGLVLFVGATGSGKTNSLAAMVGYRNRNSSSHIVCVEDPIEFVHTPVRSIITQREVGIDTDSFESALRNGLRQAPNVILIGEIRTREAMAHAITFAETGHLCLATLHASNASQALERVINFFGKERRDQLLMDLSLNLKAIFAQRLVPMRNGKGRCPAVEILLNTPMVADLIMKGDVHLLRELMRKSTNQGMQIFDQSLYQLYKDGVITPEDAIHHADSPNEVRLMIKLGGAMDAENLAHALEGVELTDPDRRL